MSSDGFIGVNCEGHADENNGSRSGDTGDLLRGQALGFGANLDCPEVKSSCHFIVQVI